MAYTWLASLPRLTCARYPVVGTPATVPVPAFDTPDETAASSASACAESLLLGAASWEDNPRSSAWATLFMFTLTHGL